MRSVLRLGVIGIVSLATLASSRAFATNRTFHAGASCRPLPTTGAGVAALNTQMQWYNSANTGNVADNLTFICPLIADATNPLPQSSAQVTVLGFSQSGPGGLFGAQVCAQPYGGGNLAQCQGGDSFGTQVYPLVIQNLPNVANGYYFLEVTLPANGGGTTFWGYTQSN